mmetsp:Transcript_5190/g.2951  ORF Transcript_5190/g.2951 Transcript_5190/m.2951 type:complete len:82 (+) Transcript_5190:179-424(+)
MGAANRRVIKEMEGFLKSSETLIKIFPTKDDICFWKVLLIGPPDSCYNFGVFLLVVNFPADYPFKPPKIRFLTSIYHCNVS